MPYEAWQIVQWYGKAEKFKYKWLPFEGSIREQPAYVVQAFELCGTLIAQAENRQIEEQQKAWQKSPKK